MRIRFALGAAAALAVAGLITSLLYQPGTAQEKPPYVKVSVAGEEKPETPAAAAPAAEPPAQPGGQTAPDANTFPPPVPGPYLSPTVSLDQYASHPASGGTGGVMFPFGSMWSTDPEAHQLWSEDQQLESEVLSLVRQLTDNSDDKERADLTTKLQSALEKQFDAQQKLREHEISQIEARVQKLRDLVRKRTDSRRKIIDNRYEQLLNDAEGLGWNSSATSPSPLPEEPLETDAEGLGWNSSATSPAGFPPLGMPTPRATRRSPVSVRMAVPGYSARPVGPLPQLPAGKKK